MLFYYVTMYEPKKFSKISTNILKDAELYSFNYKNLCFFIATVITGHIKRQIPNGVNYYYVFHNYGWAIILDNTDFIEIKYIFVYPEHRRKGFFTNIVRTLRQRNKEIIVCTKEPIMLRALVAKGFKLNGRSIDNKELSYVLPPVFPV